MVLHHPHHRFLLAVDVLGDTTDEDDETFSLVLTQAGDALILDGLAEGTIRDDDGAVAISVAGAVVMEGDDGTQAEAVFAVSLSAASGRTVRVDYATGDVTADGDDYQATSGQLTFAPGETSQTVPVPVLGDLLDEDDETFLLSLSNPIHATVADGEAEATIRDDDEVGIRVHDLVQPEGDEGSQEAVFTVSLSLLSAREITVAFTTEDVDATAGDDYTAAGT